MGNCCSTFRAVFKPNEASNSFSLKPQRAGSCRDKPDCMPKPLTSIEAGITATDGQPQVLVIKEVNLCLAENGKKHHTLKFDVMEREKNPLLVIRRGQEFIIKITGSRAYDKDKDAMSFIFTVADDDKPSYGHGSLVGVPMLAKGVDAGSGWNAVLDTVVGDVITVLVTPSADAIVGQWKMEIDSKLKDGTAVSYSHKDPFYVLFNAWCKGDQVYMKGDDLLGEYVMADTGLIWKGTHNRFQPSVWKFAQFEKDILDCSLYLMTKIGKVTGHKRGDPITIVRALSAAVNTQDDNGALLGNWDNDYRGGISPNQWIGSMEILQKYYKSKKTVKYGQCWVFSGVLTTVCRALGIPSRSVTNFASAHDTQDSLTIDYFINDKGEKVPGLSDDSVWNFHVWNEVWMERPDLSPEYGGWQVIDATPQEFSDDMLRCGPASVAAIKKGDVQRPYDNAFVFSEVNADQVFWRYTDHIQPLKLVHKDTLGVGQNISTKAVGNWTREDITNNYKYPEKSKEERATMLKALKTSEHHFSRFYLNEEFNDILFDFALRDDIKIGSPFSVVVVIKNRSATASYTVTVNLRVNAVNYMGNVKDPVKQQKFEKLVGAGKVEEVRLDVSYDEYYGRLCDQCAFNISCLANVHDTGYEFFAQDDFRVRKPDIKIKIEGDGKVVEGEEFSVSATLTNPLPIPLKKGMFKVEGPGITTQLKIKAPESVAPGADTVVKFKMTPKTSGKNSIVIKFESKELDDVDGFLNFMVKPKVELNGTSP